MPCYMFAYVFVCVCAHVHVCILFDVLTPLSHSGLLWCLLLFFLKVYFVWYKNYYAPFFLFLFLWNTFIYSLTLNICIPKAEVSFL